jgi:hypothetical protein
MSHEQAQPAARTWGIARLALFGALALWPVLWGWSPVHALGAAAFMLLFAWLPGRALVAWTLRPGTLLERVLLSWTAGLALLGIGFVLSAQLGARGALWLLPLVALLALVLGRGRQAESEELPSPGKGELLVLALVLLLTLLRVRPDMPGEWFLGFGSDDELHAGNAAELRWHWPMEDPRVAGEPLRYHFLSYCCSAAMGRVLNLPVRECLQGLTPHHAPLLIAFGMFVLARAFRANAWISGGAALALTLHADFGELTQPLTGVSWWSATPFYVGIYHSITNAAGLSLLIGLLLVLHCVISRAAAWRGGLLLAFVIALAASITKSSVLPPLLCGLGLALAWKLVRGGGFDRPLAGSLVAVGLGAAPATLWFLSDTGGYAYTMFRLLPANGVRTSPFAARVGELLGVADPARSLPLIIALLPVWLALFFGLTALGLLYWFLARTRTRTRDPLELPLALALLAGLVPALLLASPGLSELFFLDVSVVMAAPLGAVGAQWLFTRPGLRARVLAGLAAAVLCLYGAAAYTWSVIRPTFPIEQSGEPGRYRDALDWMRAELPVDAVVLADDVRLSAGLWCERRMFYSTPRFSRKQRAVWNTLIQAAGAEPPPQPYAPREQAQREFLAQPSAQGLARIRELLGYPAPLYALRSPATMTVHDHAYHADVPPRAGVDALDSFPGAECVYGNPYAAVYKLP